jgi:acyl carrier protein
VTRDDIQEQLTAIVLKEKDIAAEKLQPDTLLADAGIDSLDALTILFGIEETFGISIPDADAKSAKTFGDLVDIIERLHR